MLLSCVCQLKINGDNDDDDDDDDDDERTATNVQCLLSPVLCAISTVLPTATTYRFGSLAMQDVLDTLV